MKRIPSLVASLLFLPLSFVPLAHAERSDEIETDRPDFTEASSTVSAGVTQLESGYTYTNQGQGSENHSFPEALLRVGLFRDFFELRLAANFTSANRPDSSGADDLYLGTKLALSKQQGITPEMAVILQADVPTGGRNVSSKTPLPGVNLLYGWDLVDGLTFGGSSQLNRRIDNTNADFPEYAQSATFGLNFGGGFGGYCEWFALMPLGGLGGSRAATHYLNGGPTWKITKDIQLDVRAGFGLNASSDNFFSGAGASFRW